MTSDRPSTHNSNFSDSEDLPVASDAKSRDIQIQKRRKKVLNFFFISATLVLLFLFRDNWMRVFIGVFASYLVLKTGLSFLGALSRPIPEPPPPGELRKVKLIYRCSSCGSQLRMNLANQQVPEPPRHCSDVMDLLTSLEDQ